MLNNNLADDYDCQNCAKTLYKATVDQSEALLLSSYPTSSRHHSMKSDIFDLLRLFDRFSTKQSRHTHQKVETSSQNEKLPASIARPTAIQFTYAATQELQASMVRYTAPRHAIENFLERRFPAVPNGKGGLKRLWRICVSKSIDCKPAEYRSIRAYRSL